MLHLLSNSLQRKLLREMADPRRKVAIYIDSQSDAVREHFLKIIIFKNTTNNQNQWVNTLANIFNFCNGLRVKSKTNKLKVDEYREYLFGVTSSFDLQDASNMVYWFEITFGDKFPKFERTRELSQEVFMKYKALSDYFSMYFSKDNRNEDRLIEFRHSVSNIIL